MHKAILFILVILFILSSHVKSQDSSRLCFTSAAGLLFPLKKFASSYTTSLAFNSGIEYKIWQSFYVQFLLDFNGVKYNQQIKENNSSYLFQKTTSSIFMTGLNIGKKFKLEASKKVMISIYAGAGFINIGEPRLNVDLNTNIIEQTIKRKSGLFVKSGTRLSYKTKSKFLQTIYVDGSYWTSNLTVQQSKPQAISLYLGTRISF